MKKHHKQVALSRELASLSREMENSVNSVHVQNWFNNEKQKFENKSISNSSRQSMPNGDIIKCLGGCGTVGVTLCMACYPKVQSLFGQQMHAENKRDKMVMNNMNGMNDGSMNTPKSRTFNGLNDNSSNWRSSRNDAKYQSSVKRSYLDNENSNGNPHYEMTSMEFESKESRSGGASSRHGGGGIMKSNKNDDDEDEHDGYDDYGDDEDDDDDDYRDYEYHNYNVNSRQNKHWKYYDEING